jgi:histidine triad (HIT) family protein
MSDCVFCKIGAREIPAKEVYRDEDVVAIEDLNPQAPVHLLVMPAQHYDTLFEVFSGDEGNRLVQRLIEVASQLGERHGKGGYRLVVNTGREGGQTVGHVHVHVLAGRRMSWPPG